MRSPQHVWMTACQDCGQIVIGLVKTSRDFIVLLIEKSWFGAYMEGWVCPDCYILRTENFNERDQDQN
jgi:hypothetical protein